MKNIVLSAVAVLAMSSFAVAGGDIAPVEEPVVVEPVVTDAGFYLGLAYGYANMDLTETEYFAPTATTRSSVRVTDLGDDSYNTIMLQAGYKFNEYVAVEGRYWFGLDEDFGLGNGDYNIDTWGLYVKPMYPVTDAFDIYALLGYANTDQGNAFSDTTLDGFSWGLGGSYEFTENFAVFIDYVNMYNDTDRIDYVGGDYDELDFDISTWNFGVTYKF